MNLRRLTARTAIAGVSTALAAGALVGVGSTSAHAAEVSNVYNCTTALGAQAATLTVIGDLPVPEYAAGAPVPAGIVNVIAGIDASTAGALKTFLQATSVRIDDFAVSLGTSKVAIPLSGELTQTAWNGSGANKAAVTPDAGNDVAALMPKAVTVTVVNASGETKIPCALQDGQTPATLATIDLLKQTTVVKAPKSVKGKVGKATKFKATVTGQAGSPKTGKLVVKEGKKTVGSAKIKNGKAVVTIKKLKAGKHKLVLSFAGNGSFKADKAKTTLKIVKKK